ncbi:uncharacterized protein LOC129230701 [Uloborus diversus]|uniref:uncharacterized protein LOC129230701 n=1 Tax=Uloborus diversus TaxID=327109 RepID=UPI00240A204B|nr:uncharacterized protein LOC129230701 [Uloborus diversus]
MIMFPGLLLFTLVYFKIVVSLAPNGLSPSTPPPESNEADIYPCWRDITCVLGDEAEEEINPCYDLLTDKEMELALKWMEEGSKGFIKEKELDRALDKYCDLVEDDKQAVHTYLANKLMDRLAVVCNSNDQEICDQWRGMTNCICDVIDGYSDEQICGQAVDAQRKVQ